jgi:LacI family transcriptional regulator
LIATTDWDLEAEHQHLSALAERRVDGIILMSVDPGQDFDGLARPGVPIVVVDRPRFALRAATIATEHLIWHGHRRIAVIGGQSRLLGSRRRTSAWESTMVAAGLDVPSGYRAEAPMTREGGYEAAMVLFGLEFPPTAVFVESDAQAAGLLRAAADRGLRVPNDVAIVTSEGTQVARYAVPSLSTVEQPIGTIAGDAVAAAYSATASSAGVRHIDNTEATLVVRESCGCE